MLSTWGIFILLSCLAWCVHCLAGMSILLFILATLLVMSYLLLSENVEYLVEFRLPALQRKVASDQIIQDDSDSEHR